jgi:hypothetical protein
MKRLPSPRLILAAFFLIVSLGAAAQANAADHEVVSRPTDG